MAVLFGATEKPGSLSLLPLPPFLWPGFWKTKDGAGAPVQAVKLTRSRLAWWRADDSLARARRELKTTVISLGQMNLGYLAGRSSRSPAPGSGISFVSRVVAHGARSFRPHFLASTLFVAAWIGIFGDLKSRALQSLVLLEFGVTHPLPDCISARRDSTFGNDVDAWQVLAIRQILFPFLAQRVASCKFLAND